MKTATAIAPKSFTLPSSGYYTVCAWCNKVQIAPGLWMLSEESCSDAVTHGICPDCLAAMKRELQSYRLTMTPAAV